MKRIMTITELIQLGYSKKFLYKLAHMPNSPAFRVCKGGTFYFDMERLEDFLKENTIR